MKNETDDWKVVSTEIRTKTTNTKPTGRGQNKARKQRSVEVNVFRNQFEEYQNMGGICMYVLWGQNLLIN